MKRLARYAERLDWIDLAVLGGAVLAAAANVAAGAWVVVPVVALIGFITVRAAWWRTEFEAECQSHDFTQHQLDEARAEVRRLSGDVVRWIDEARPAPKMFDPAGWSRALDRALGEDGAS